MLDALDRGLIHALQIDGRAPFSRIAGALGVSTQTVARRYRRLYAEASLRVVGLADPDRAGQARWMVRLTATPHAAQDLALALARRDDTSWVKLTSGGTEIVAIIHTPAGGEHGHALLLHEVPRTAAVTGVSAHYLLHLYLGGPAPWRGRTGTLDERQRRLLQPPVPAGGAAARPALTGGDDDLMAALGHDGRASHTDLAAATGWSPATVARRLADLQAGGAIFFDVDVDATLFGVTTQALLWMAVAPAHLDRVATALARHDELAFVAATTGRTNLVAHALCPDPAALHHYLTHRLGDLDAIHTLETAPVLRTVKGSGTVTARGRPGRGGAGARGRRGR